MCRALLKNFIPNMCMASVYVIPYDRLYAEGKRGAIFDIDNTLVMHGAPATAAAIAFFEHLRSLGYRTLVLSNNGVDRVRSFADAVGAEYIFKAGKPKKEGYLRACEKLGITPAEAVFAGDQIFTDILGARRSGMLTVLVDPIDPREEVQIRIKRKLEKPVLKLSGHGRK